MNTIYWYGVIGNIQLVFAILFFISIIVSGVSTAIVWGEWMSGNINITKKKWQKKNITKLWILTVIFSFGAIFIPTKGQLMEIYGPGEIVEHLRHGDIENLSPETIQIFEEWANERR